MDARLYNKIYLEFWKKFAVDPENIVCNEYKSNYQFNMIYFLECLATCHSIDKLNNDSLGNTIDLNLQNCVKWIQEKTEFGENENDTVL